MIKFFRRIRQNLLAEGKTGKYLKYAIGEILLVMVGIILALQVNNWNEERISRHKEKILLKELHEEFIENKKQFIEVNSYHKRAMESTRSVIDLFPIDYNSIDLDTLRNRARSMSWQNTFNPSQGIIKSLVNTSSFELISNPDLRKLLVSWEDILADYQEEEINAAEKMRTLYLPLLMENIPGWFRLKDQRMDLSYLSSFQFENIFIHREMDLRGILGGFGDEEITRIQQTMDWIIELSKPEDY